MTNFNRLMVGDSCNAGAGTILVMAMNARKKSWKEMWGVVQKSSIG